jgi:hypothetical protein
MPPRQDETLLRGLQPLPSWEGEIHVRGVQVGTRGSDGDQARARDQARTVHYSRLLRVWRVKQHDNLKRGTR